MTPAQIVSPSSAPFSVPVIPMGMARPLTAPEVAAINILFPKPPNGFTVWNTTTGAPKP